MNRNRVNCAKQNKMHYIAEDIQRRYPEISKDFIYCILLKRGFFKWIAIRYEIIRFKQDLKEIIKTLQHPKNQKQKGYYQAIEMVRRKIGELCHSSRWQAPFNDTDAKKFIRRIQ